MKVRRTCPACGYTADYATAALADAHHRRHCCATHRRGLEHAHRQVQRRQPRVTRECTHPQARHRHGTRAAKARPLPLPRVHRRQHRRQPHRLPRADLRQMAALPRRRCRARAPRRLRAAGIGVERIAQLTGLSVSHVRQLAEQHPGDSPGTQRVRPGTATRVLGIGIDKASQAPGSRVDATGMNRRLHALIALGWPVELLAAQLHRRPGSVHRSLIGTSVTARTAHQVAALYERLVEHFAATGHP